MQQYSEEAQHASALYFRLACMSEIRQSTGKQKLSLHFFMAGFLPYILYVWVSVIRLSEEKISRKSG